MKEEVQGVYKAFKMKFALECFKNPFKIIYLFSWDMCPSATRERMWVNSGVLRCLGQTVLPGLRAAGGIQMCMLEAQSRTCQ